MTIRTIRDQAAPVTVGETTVTARSQSILIDLPFARFVWNRPTEVLIERDGHASRVHVLDITRLLELGFFGLAFVFSIATLVTRMRRG